MRCTLCKKGRTFRWHVTEIPRRAPRERQHRSAEWEDLTRTQLSGAQNYRHLRVLIVTSVVNVGYDSGKFHMYVYQIGMYVYQIGIFGNVREIGFCSLNIALLVWQSVVQLRTWILHDCTFPPQPESLQPFCDLSSWNPRCRSWGHGASSSSKGCGR